MYRSATARDDFDGDTLQRNRRRHGERFGLLSMHLLRKAAHNWKTKIVVQKMLGLLPARLAFSVNDKLIERNFEQMTIIYAKDESLSLKETTLIYIDEMLKFFPENSSKVDLYIAKAKLLCKDSTETARQHIDLAEGFLSGGSVEFQCD